MANPICLSPLKFYDSPVKQEFRKSYAYGHISPLIIKANILSPFQFVIPNNLPLKQLSRAYIRDIHDNRITGDIANRLIETGFSIISADGYNVAIFLGVFPIPEIQHEGQYYLELISEDNIWSYYSEVFCCTNNLADYLEIEYWNDAGDFSLKNGTIAFANGFRFKLYLKSELGKPEYNFEEEATKRLGYSFIESQVSKKIYRFNAVVPEYICDAMRLIRLCSNKTLISKGETYDMLSFDMDIDWQQQGDLASATCEFETDNVLVNLGGFTPTYKDGDFKYEHFNNDFYNQ